VVLVGRASLGIAARHGVQILIQNAHCDEKGPTATQHSINRHPHKWYIHLSSQTDSDRKIATSRGKRASQAETINSKHCSGLYCIFKKTLYIYQSDNTFNYSTETVVYTVSHFIWSLSYLQTSYIVLYSTVYTRYTVRYRGIQEFRDKLVPGLCRNHIQPYFIRKLQP
jgi:hypothetical protein